MIPNTSDSSINILIRQIVYHLKCDLKQRLKIKKSAYLEYLVKNKFNRKLKELK